MESRGHRNGDHAIPSPPSLDQSGGGGERRLGGRKPSLRSKIQLRIYRLWRSIYWRLKPSPLVCEIARELCSLPRRIGTICATKPYLLGIEIGPLGQIPARALRYKQTRACIRDMQHIARSHPWANLLDQGLFVEGWNLGTKWALGETGTSHSDTAQIDDSASDVSSAAQSTAQSKSM